MNRVWLVVVWAAVGVGCAVEESPAAFETQSFGDPQNGFPNPYERALFMAANRTRSDPATVKGPQSKIYPAQAPLAPLYDLSRSARFHANTLGQGKAPLMHASPCTLKSDVATSGCDGAPACACTTGASCNSCGTCAAGTDVGTRIKYFAPANRGWGEIIAAGYGDPWRVMDGWVNEADGADGHRVIVTSGGYGVVGFGHVDSVADACWRNFDAGDFGGDKPATGRIPSAAPKPIGGAAGSYRVYATWSDPAGAPASLRAVVDGACVDMTRELGDPKLNATYLADVPLQNGCHSVYVLGRSVSGERATYPSATAFTIKVGSGACAESVAQPTAACEAPTPPADLGGSDGAVGSDGSSDGGGGSDGAVVSLPDLALPGTDAPPTVTLDRPTNGTVYRPSSTVTIQATAKDDRAIKSVVANWARDGVISRFTLTRGAGDAYATSVRLGSSTGTRVISVTATDDTGKATTTAPVPISVQ